MENTCRTCEKRSGNACTVLIRKTAQRLPFDKGGTTIVLDAECVAYLKVEGNGVPKPAVPAYSPRLPLPRL